MGSSCLVWVGDDCDDYGLRLGIIVQLGLRKNVIFSAGKYVETLISDALFRRCVCREMEGPLSAK